MGRPGGRGETPRSSAAPCGAGATPSHDARVTVAGPVARTVALPARADGAAAEQTGQSGKACAVVASAGR